MGKRNLLSSNAIFNTLFLVLIILSHSTTVNAFPTVYPTGTTIYNPQKAYNGYTLYNPEKINSGLNRILLIDMSGNIMHTWQHDEYNLVYAEPLSNGHLLTLYSIKTNENINGLIELDTNSNVVWEYFDNSRLHHDFERLENGNTLVLCSENRVIPVISQKNIEDDCILEINPEKQIVWEWYTSEHFDEFGFNTEAKALIYEQGGDWSHTNSIQSLPDNSLGDMRFKKGNILVSQRHTNIIFIIDKDTGRIVWKIGPDNNLTIGQHDANMIPPSFDGAGNIMVFDNGGYWGYPRKTRLYSRVVEIDPMPDVIVWQYNALRSNKPLWSFFSPQISSAQKLPNGNILIDEGMNGRFFEISRDGEIVWEYINPFFWTPYGIQYNGVYRIWRVDLNWVPN